MLDRNTIYYRDFEAFGKNTLLFGQHPFLYVLLHGYTIIRLPEVISRGCVSNCSLRSIRGWWKEGGVSETWPYDWNGRAYLSAFMMAREGYELASDMARRWP